MDFGMSVLIENKSIQDNIALCRRLRLDFLELNMNLPEYQAERLEDTGYFKELAEEAGIYYTIHLDENMNIADFNSAILGERFWLLYIRWPEGETWFN